MCAEDIGFQKEGRLIQNGYNVFLEQGTSNYIDKSVIITETMWVVVCSWEIVCIYTA